MHLITVSAIAALTALAAAGIPSPSPTAVSALIQGATDPYGNISQASLTREWYGKNISDSDPDPRFAHHNLTKPHTEITARDVDSLLKRMNFERSTTKSGGSGKGMYECNAKWFKGTCKWTELKRGNNHCTNAAYWPNGSIGPDKGVYCYIYEAADCSIANTDAAQQDGFVWPGAADCNNSPMLGGKDFQACPRSWWCFVD